MGFIYRQSFVWCTETANNIVARAVICAINRVGVVERNSKKKKILASDALVSINKGSRLNFIAMIKLALVHEDVFRVNIKAVCSHGVKDS